MDLLKACLLGCSGTSPVKYIGGSSSINGGSITLPGDTLEGDLVIVAASYTSNNSKTVTGLDSSAVIYQHLTSKPYGTCWRGLAQSVNRTLTFTYCSAVVCAVFRNASYYSYSHAFSNVAVSMPNPPSRSGFVDGDVSVAVGVYGDDYSANWISLTAPSGYTKVTQSVGNTSGQAVCIGYKEDVVGTEDPAVFGGAIMGSNYPAWNGFTIRIGLEV